MAHLYIQSTVDTTVNHYEEEKATSPVANLSPPPIRICDYAKLLKSGPGNMSPQETTKELYLESR